MRERFVPSDDRMLWTRCEGRDDGIPLLLIAGANASGLMWPDEFVGRLTADGCRVIRYDHRDTGKSTHKPFAQFPYTVEDLARDAIAVLDGWKIEKAHVVGMSLGATIGQVLALDHPRRLASITLMCGAALDVDFVGNIARAFTGEPSPDGLPLPRKDVLDVLSQRSRQPLTLAEAVDARIHEWRHLAGSKTPFKAEEFAVWERRCIEHAGAWEQPVNHAYAKPVPLERGKELRRVVVPTLVIQGMEDPLNPPPHGRHIANLIPSARLVEIDSLGHALPASFHKRVADEIVKHVRGKR